MSEIIIANIYIFVLASVLAILEIQIEGPHGWAQNLPTWRPKNSKSKLNRLYSKFMSGRETTGYHITMFTFVFLILHLPYVFTLPFNLYNWSMTLSMFLIFIVLWDYLWFVYNPHYPLKQFNKEKIWWHKQWLLSAPRDYYFSFLLSAGVLLPAVLFYDDASLISWWLTNVVLFALQTILVILFTIYVLKIDNWQSKK